MAYNLDRHIVRLLMDEPYFAALSRRVDKQATRAIPTAGVRVNEKTQFFEMVYNPDFFDTLTEEEVKVVLMHEFYHLTFLHVTERLPAEGMSKQWNHATDLAINGEIFRNYSADQKTMKEGEVERSIRNLYEIALSPGKEPYPGLPVGKTAEWYFKYVKENWDEIKEKMKGQGMGDPDSGEGQEGQGAAPGDGDNPIRDFLKGQGSPIDMDDHGGWDEDGKIPNDLREMMKEKARQLVKEAAQQANKRGWGTVSGDMKQAIIKSLQTVVDWRKVLRYFIKTSQKADRSSSIKRINRRYPYIHAGKKTNRVAKIAISIDQSGSVGNAMLGAFFAELEKLAQLAEFTVVPFDTRVDDKLVFVWKKGEKFKAKRVLCGGTDFNAPTKWVNEHGGFDGHIVLTDMEAPAPVPSKCQRMWMTDEHGRNQPYFQTQEKVIAITYDNEAY